MDRIQLTQSLEEIAASVLYPEPSRMRMSLRSDGTVSYASPIPILPDNSSLQAIVWHERSLSTNPLLGHKVTFRPLYDPAIQQARGAGYVDALFLNEDGKVTEGAVHSIFIHHEGQWKTPTLGAGVLPGVYRRYMLETMPDITETDFGLQELLHANEVWLTNAVRGVRKVTVVDRLRG